MEREELRKVLDLHEKWMRKESGGIRADLQGADLRDADLQGADLQGANLRGADIDYAAWPLWCRSLEAYIDDRIAIQILYHLLRPAQASPYVSQEVKERLLTDDLIDLANRFHRVVECGEIER
nr:MAG TPA: pentapeptide repeat protein [Caudoviricetes sp.]